MEAPERGALMLVRFVASALIAWALVEIAQYLAICWHKQLPVEILPCCLKAIPFILGLIILIKSKSLARWLSDKLDF